jgi:hypothetical protein
VFWEKRLQTIENKGNECRKEHKERTKRLQADANKRVGKPEARKSIVGTDGAYSPVMTGSMRKLLRTGEILTPRGADDGRRAVSGGRGL